MTTRTYSLQDLALCRQVTSLDLALARAQQQLIRAKALGDNAVCDAFTVEHLKAQAEMLQAVVAVKEAHLADGCFTTDGIVNRCYLIIRGDA